MAFRIKREEKVCAAVARLLTTELEAARRHIQSRAGSRKEHFHEARKGLKRARSVLRLAREPLGDKRFRRENTACRDTARVLSRVRDAQVLADTLAELLESAVGKSGAKRFATIEQGIADYARRVEHEVLDDKRAIRGAVKALDAAIERTRSLSRESDWPTGEQGWQAIEDGLRRVYRGARASFHEAYSAPSDTAFHEWRKGAKYLRHQIAVLRDAWEKPLADLCGELHSLSDCLGRDHDLAMLRETLAADPGAFGDAATLGALYALIAARQEALRRDAEPRGRRLFAEKPRAFVHRLGDYWSAWRDDGAKRGSPLRDTAIVGRGRLLPSRDRNVLDGPARPLHG